MHTSTVIGIEYYYVEFDIINKLVYIPVEIPQLV